MLRIARALRDPDSRDAAQAFEKAQRASSDELADLLADFAVVIATAGSDDEAVTTRGSR